MGRVNPSLRISVELNEQLLKIAEEKDVSKNKLMTWVLTDYAKNYCKLKQQKGAN